MEVDEGSDHGKPVLVQRGGKTHSGTESTREVAKTTDADFATTGLIRQRTRGSTSRTLERVASSIFVPAGPPSWPRKKHRRRIFLADDLGLPHISSRATVGRNSRFHNLTARDREKLGGIEYRSLRLLIKVLVGTYIWIQVSGTDHQPTFLAFISSAQSALLPGLSTRTRSTVRF